MLLLLKVIVVDLRQAKHAIICLKRHLLLLRLSVFIVHCLAT